MPSFGKRNRQWGRGFWGFWGWGGGLTGFGRRGLVGDWGDGRRAVGCCAVTPPAASKVEAIGATPGLGPGRWMSGLQPLAGPGSALAGWSRGGRVVVE